jgi:uncharacterized protein Yka (UPF0111/DUF47 family)
MSIFHSELWSEEEEKNILNQLGDGYTFTEDDRLLDTYSGLVQGKLFRPDSEDIPSEDYIHNSNNNYYKKYFNGKHGGPDESITEFLDRAFPYIQSQKKLIQKANAIVASFWNDVKVKTDDGKLVNVDIKPQLENMDELFFEKLEKREEEINNNIAEELVKGIDNIFVETNFIEDLTETTENIEDALEDIGNEVEEQIENIVETVEENSNIIEETFEDTIETIEETIETIEEIPEIINEKIKISISPNNTFMDEIDGLFDGINNLLKILLELIVELTSYTELLQLIPFAMSIYVGLKVYQSLR